MKLGNKIKKVLGVDPENFSVKIEFTDKSVLTIPMNHIFARPKGLAAEILRGGMFEKCFVESGALAWPNGLELCPDAMKMWAVSHNTMQPTRKKVGARLKRKEPYSMGGQKMARGLRGK